MIGSLALRSNFRAAPIERGLFLGIRSTRSSGGREVTDLSSKPDRAT